MKSSYKTLGDYIQEVKVRNTDLSAKELLGINVNKFFMPSVANIVGTDLSTYRVVKKNQFACNRMHVGRDYRIPISLSSRDEPFIVSPAYDVFEVRDTEVLDPEFLMMWFSRAEYDRNAWFYTDADVRGGLPWKAFTDMKFPLLSPSEQKNLVAEYKSIQNRITVNQQIIKKLEQTSQAIYKEWFVTNIDLENLPKGWRLGKISEVANIIMGQSPEGESYNEVGEGSPLINGPVEFGEYLTIKSKWTTKPKKFCNKDELILCVRGSTVGRFVVSDDKYAIGRGVCAIRSKNQLYTQLAIKVNLPEILKDVTGSTFPNLDRKTLEDFKIVVPSEEILHNFEALTTPLNRFLINKAQEVYKLNELKNLLLAKMARA